MAVTRHVVPGANGGWLVVKDPSTGAAGRQHESMLFERKRDAEAFAKDAVRQGGGGEVVLHTPSGRITEVDTVGAPDAATVVV
jgi:hypothetical protein